MIPTDEYMNRSGKTFWPAKTTNDDEFVLHCDEIYIPHKKGVQIINLGNRVEDGKKGILQSKL